MEAKQRLQPTRNVGKGERVASVLLGTGMLAYSIYRFSTRKVVPALGSAYLFYRGLSGKDPVYRMLKIRRAGEDEQAGIQVVRAVTILKPRDEIYAFWRKFSNLPRFMKHLQSVSELSQDGRISRWAARLPLAGQVEWDAEVTEDIRGERIAWRSLPGSLVETTGKVTFQDAPPGQGTVISVELMYDQPAGSAGAFVLKLFGEEPAQQVEDDLRRLKQLLEAGQVASVFGQTSARVKEVKAERKQLQDRAVG